MLAKPHLLRFRRRAYCFFFCMLNSVIVCLFIHSVNEVRWPWELEEDYEEEGWE